MNLLQPFPKVSLNRFIKLPFTYYTLMYNYERFKYKLKPIECMANESIFLEHIGDSPRMRVLQYLIEGRDFDYTLTDMLNAGVSWGDTK